MEFDNAKAELILKFLQKAKWEMGLHESATLIPAYKWLQEFLEYTERNPRPKAKPINKKKALT